MNGRSALGLEPRQPLWFLMQTVTDISQVGVATLLVKIRIGI